MSLSGETSSLYRAKEVLKLLKEMGPLGLRAFTYSRMNWAILKSISLNEDGSPPYDLEEVDRISTFCEDVQDYIKMWLNDEKHDYPAKLFLKPPEALLKIPNGVYYLYLRLKEEFHWFVWVVDGSELTYAGGYGGMPEMALRTFPKSEYLEKFLKALNGSLEDYQDVFALGDYLAIDSVTFKRLEVTKSKRYPN